MVPEGPEVHLHLLIDFGKFMDREIREAQQKPMSEEAGFFVKELNLSYQVRVAYTHTHRYVYMYMYIYIYIYTQKL